MNSPNQQVQVANLNVEKEKYKSEIQASWTKHEITCQDLKLQKSENESLQKSNKSFSVAVKSLKKDLSDTIKKKDEEIKKMSDKILRLEELSRKKRNLSKREERSWI